MKIGMVSIAGILACASALAEQGFAGLADPTRPAGVAQSRDAVEPVPVGPVLQSTMVSPDIKRAVISGQSYGVGDRLGTAVIVDIHPYEVVLDQGGRETRLRIVPPLARDAMQAGGKDKMRKTP